MILTAAFAFSPFSPLLACHDSAKKANGKDSAEAQLRLSFGPADQTFWSRNVSLHVSLGAAAADRRLHHTLRDFANEVDVLIAFEHHMQTSCSA